MKDENEESKEEWTYCDVNFDTKNLDYICETVLPLLKSSTLFYAQYVPEE